jgi:hypothetical protein
MSLTRQGLEANPDISASQCQPDNKVSITRLAAHIGPSKTRLRTGAKKYLRLLIFPDPMDR